MLESCTQKYPTKKPQNELAESTVVSAPLPPDLILILIAFDTHTHYPSLCIFLPEANCCHFTKVTKQNKSKFLTSKRCLVILTNTGIIDCIDHHPCIHGKIENRAEQNMNCFIYNTEVLCVSIPEKNEV